MIHRPFTLEPRAGELIRGDVRLPDGPSPRAAVVVVHGFKGFKDWGFFPWVADTLVEAGYAAVSFNFSRNGVGPGGDRFTEMDRFGANTLSLEQDELRWVLSRVLEGTLIQGRPERVALLGHSRGGGQAILAASADPGVSALVTWGSVSYFDRWTEETKAEWRARGRMWVLNQRTGEQLPVDVGLLEDFEANQERLDVAASATRVTAPWLILHGTEDPTVWHGESESLSRANPSATLRLVPGGDHTFQVTHPFQGVTPELRFAMDATLEHLRAHLGR